MGVKPVPDRYTLGWTTSAVRQFPARDWGRIADVEKADAPILTLLRPPSYLDRYKSFIS